MAANHVVGATVPNITAGQQECDRVDGAAIIRLGGRWPIRIDRIGQNVRPVKEVDLLFAQRITQVAIADPSGHA